MSRLVRIFGGGKKLVEISGLHGIWVGSDHLNQSVMTLYYLNHKTEKITYQYGEWDECNKDAKILKEAKSNFISIPLKYPPTTPQSHPPRFSNCS
jgi:hypothetical protein